MKLAPTGPALGAALLALLFAACADEPPPRPETAEELAASTTIVRDSWGVPHVYGPTDESVVFGFLYAQAEDNFWQIEDSIVQALGRAAETYGEDALPGDLLNRALEIPRLSREEWERTDPKIQALCRAGVAALNWYLETHPEVEPRVIEEFEPWHLMAFSRFAVYQLFMFGRAGIRPEEMATLATPLDPAAERVAELGALPWERVLGWPGVRDSVGGDAAPPLPSASAAVVAHRSGAAPPPAGLPTAGAPVVGSNMWAVTGDRTASGKPFLFINPHQPYFGPGQWYEGHVHSDEGLHFSGAGFFGSPLPTIGHNERLGWSHTVNAPDILDVYLVAFDDSEDPLAYRYGDQTRRAVTWTDSVSVKTDEGLEAREFEFRKTHHGPVLGERDGRALVLRMAKFDEGGQLGQRYAMARASSLEEWKAAMATLATPMFNTVYADVDGNIGYLYYGAIPRRDPGFDWSQPVDGSDPATEWSGYHALDELPQVWNPASGYVQNCNATPFLASGPGDNPDETAFPPYMVSEDDNARSRISRRLLEADPSFTFERWAEMAWDTTVIEAEDWIPRLAEALAGSGASGELAEPLGLLEGWDGVATKESEAMTLFFAWREVMIRSGVEDPVAAFRQALASLEETWGSWRVAWGEMNRLQRIHTSGRGDFSDEEESLAVAGGPGPLGIVFNFYTRPQEGAQRRYGVAGHSFVSVVDFGAPAGAQSILVFGQSADPESPHWFDQARLFADRRFKPAWFERTAVEEDAQTTYSPADHAP